MQRLRLNGIIFGFAVYLLFTSLPIFGMAQKSCKDPLLVTDSSEDSSASHRTGWSELEADRWDRSVGYAWQATLGEMNLSPRGTVVEVAPGDRAKVGYGLQGLGFRGVIYIIEPNKPSLDRLIKKYKRLIPQAKVIGLNSSLLDSLRSLPRDIDALVSNHPLDDMILNYSISKEQSAEIFNFADSAWSDLNVQEAWGELKTDIQRRQKAQAQVINDWVMTIQAVNPEVVAISQYESGYFKSISLREPDIAANEVLVQLKQKYQSKKDTSAHSYTHEDAIEQRLRNLNMQSDRWLVARLRSSQNDTPIAVERWGTELFVTNQAMAIAESKSPTLYRFRSDAPTHKIQILNSNSRPKESAETSNPLEEQGVVVWVDRQADPSNIALNGNLGSGRAAYVGRNLNLKGVGRTSLATGKDKGHSNGALDLSNAFWEMIGSNITYANMQTSSAPVTAIFLRGDKIIVPFVSEPVPAAIIERRDVGRSLDRPVHLHALQKPVSRSELLRMATQFGRQDAEKFLERIVHGAWSAGNISIEGHMIDFDTVAAVKGRSPHFTSTGDWTANQFGLEYLGQLLILSDLVNSALNIDKVSYSEIEAAFYSARTNQLHTRFSKYMGIGPESIEYFNLAHKIALERLVEKFEKVSRYMYPNFAAMAEWSKDVDTVSVFDMSKFMRFYPIWFKEKLTPKDILTKIQNPKNYNAVDADEVHVRVQEDLNRMGLIVSNDETLQRVQHEVLEFISEYERLLGPLLESDEANRITANAYRVNEDRNYFRYAQGFQTMNKILKLYLNGRISSDELQARMNLLLIANDRNPIERDGDYALVDIRIFEEGWVGARIYLDGTIESQITVYPQTRNPKAWARRMSPENLIVEERNSRNEIVYRSAKRSLFSIE